MSFSENWEQISIGSDESGKGDFFGAPCVVAVYLSPESLKKLKSEEFYLKIRDSKKCDDTWILENTQKIMQICEHSVRDVTTSEYNNLYSKYKNMNILFSIFHNEVHSKIDHKAFRVIDAFTDKQKYYEYLSSVDISSVPVDYMVDKAESKYLSVALASIIARYYFIKKIQKLSEESGVRVPFGNSYIAPNSVIDAYRNLLGKGYSQKDIDQNFVKANFATLKKIKETINLT